MYCQKQGLQYILLNCLELLSKCQLISQSKPVAHLLNSGNIQAIHTLDIFHQCSYNDSVLREKERNIRNTSSTLTMISICFPSGGRKIWNWCISHLFRKLFLRMQPFANEMLLDKGAEISETPFWQKGFWVVLGKSVGNHFTLRKFLPFNRTLLIHFILYLLVRRLFSRSVDALSFFVLLVTFPPQHSCYEYETVLGNRISISSNLLCN